MTTVEHLLVCLMEEAGEITQEGSKANRFGLDDVNPNDPSGGSNRERIRIEVNQLVAVYELLQEHGVFPPWGLDDAKARIEKREKLTRMMAYARERGTLTP